MERTLRRRRLLQLAAGAGATAMAGCLGGGDDANDDDGNGDDTENGDDANGDDTGNGAFDGPEYATYLAPDASNETFVAYVDFQRLSELEDAVGDPEQGSGEPGEVGDPLIDTPVSAAFFVALVAGFGIGTTGLGSLLADEDEQQTDVESTIDEQFLVNQGLALRGDIDTAEVQTLLSDVSGALQPFEPVDEDGEHTLYQAAGGGSGGQTIAVSSEDIIESQQREAVEAVIETKRGERESTISQFPEFQWLLSTAEESQLAFGGYNPDEFEVDEEVGVDDDLEEDPLTQLDPQPNGVMYSASLSGDLIEAVAAISFETDVTDEAESVIRDEFGMDAQELEFDVDGNRILITGRYDISAVLESE